MATLVLSACGARTGLSELDVESAQRDAGSTPDAGATSDSGAPLDSAAPSDGGLDAGCACPTVPSTAWSIVAFATSGADECPAGFGPGGDDFLENPTLGNACTCGTACATDAADCSGLMLQSTYGATCNVNGVVDSIGDGGCQSIPSVFGGTACGIDPAIVDVSCTGPEPTQNVNDIAAQHDLVCPLGVPTCGLCSSPIAPFQTCIMAAGDEACPAGVPNKHALGSMPEVSCGPCPCKATAECQGTIAFYSDTNCGGAPELEVPAGGCVDVASGEAIGSYLWTAGPAPTPVCTIGASSGAVTLGNTQTVCCP